MQRIFEVRNALFCHVLVFCFSSQSVALDGSSQQRPEKTKPNVPAETIRLQAIQTTVSGTLSPFLLTMDGKKILTEEFPVRNLTLNGNEIPVENNAERSFFVRLNQDSFVVKITKTNGEAKNYPPIELPKITALSIESREVCFTVAGQVQNLFVNGVEIPVKAGRGTWRPPLDAAVLLGPQVAEIRSSANLPDRFYDWKFRAETVSYLLSSRLKGPAEPAKSKNAVPIGLKIFSFELAPIYITQKDGGRTASLELGWAPHYFLSQKFFSHALIGVSLLEGASGKNFLALSTELFLSYFFSSRFSIGAGGGAVTWFNNGGTRPAVGALLGFRLHPRGKFPLLDRIFLSYSKVIALNPSDIWRVGLGILF